MKSIWIFCSCLLLFSGSANTQTLGRVTFSSGGSSTSNQLPASFGEVFVGGNNQMTMGSQQSSIDSTSATAEPRYLFDVRISPNPAFGIIRVQLMQGVPVQGFVRIASANGQLIHSQDFHTATFEYNAARLSAGTYFLTLFDQQGSLLKTLSFIKQ